MKKPNIYKGILEEIMRNGVVTRQFPPPPNEVYTDLEDMARLWTKEELIDKLIFLAHEHGNDMELGKKVRQELIKYDNR